MSSGHVHEDKIVGYRQSTGKNLFGEEKTANMVDLICTICNQKTVKYERM